MLINHRLTHNLKVVGSNPTPATKPYLHSRPSRAPCVRCTLRVEVYLSGPNMFIERTLKASVVMVIPFLFALLAGLVLLGITVARELIYKFNNVFSLTTNDTILFALKLVDAVLIVNLLIIVALASYRQLVDNTAQPTDKQRDYGVASDITLADMKRKLLGSALAIGVIAVLADLMKLTSSAADFTTTLPLIVKSFVVLIFAIAAFLNSKS